MPLRCMARGGIPQPFLTLPSDTDEWSALCLRKRALVPIQSEDGRTLQLAWRLKREKSLAPARDQTPVIQFLACHYPD
jgi:hypothetical protein